MTEAITGVLERQSRTDIAKRRIRLTGGPVIDMGVAYRRDRRFRVVWLELTWERGVLNRVRVSGPVVRNDGTDGVREQGLEWGYAAGLFISQWNDEPPPGIADVVAAFSAVPTWEEIDNRKKGSAA